MVEVSYESFGGSDGIDKTYYYHVHDLLRDLAVEKAKEDNFLALCSTPDNVQSCSGARRLAIHHFDIDRLVKHVSLNLRTLMCFDSHLPNCSGHRILKVLRYESFREESFRHESFEGLTQLRYLRFDLWWDADIDNPVRFVKLISSMKFLQTLDLRCIKPYDFSDFNWDIETLRHVILPQHSFGPPSGANLRNMQTLIGIKNRESWGAEALPYLPNLCTLSVKITDGFPWEIGVAFLRTLKKLVLLHLEGHEIPIEIIDMRGFPFYQKLTSLDLYGKFTHGAGVALDAAMFPTHLTKLVYRYFGIQQDPMAVLQKLHNLKALEFINGNDEDLKQIRCSAGGFPNLENLFICNFNNLEEWVIEDGAMPMLQQLYVQHCRMLQVPQGLKHLATVRKLIWSLYRGQDPTTTEEELRNLCSHVPQLVVFS
jgi:hypothetical protein